MTLLEVMLALAVIGIMLAPLFITQGSMIKRVRTESQTITRMQRALQFLYETDIDRQLKKDIISQKEIERPAMRITYKETDPTKESALSRYEHIKLHTVSWNWNQAGEQLKDMLVTVAYQPPLQEKQEQ